MTKIKEKLTLALADADTAKELEKFGITSDLLEGIEDLKTPETLDEALKAFNFQPEFDKRIAKSLSTREENLKAKYDFVEKDQAKVKKEEVKTQDPALQAVLDQLQELKDKLAQQDQDRAKETQAQKINRLTEDLKTNGIPAIYAKEFDLEKDLEDQFEAVKKQFETDFGTIAKPSSKLPFPKRPETKNEPSKAEAEEFSKYI